MEHRGLNEEYQPSPLGFRCMRLPLDAREKIDEVEAERMLDTTIAHGVKYIDTAFPYHHGGSKLFVDRVLRRYDGSSYYLATKLSFWDLSTLEGVRAIFESQLERLNVAYVDFYLLCALDKTKQERAEQLDALAYCKELKTQGKIWNPGFSFHDEYDVSEEILTYRKWDSYQIQYNYVNTQEQVGDYGHALAEKLGVLMIIIEPAKSGSFSKLPQDLASCSKEAAPSSSTSSWMFRWIVSKPNVKVVLNGMSTIEQVLDNLSAFGDLKPPNVAEQGLIKEIIEEIKARTMNDYTGCAYCMPYPSGLDIPKSFRVWNEHTRYGNMEVARKRYFGEMREEEGSSQCKKHGKYEALYPQHIAICEDLAYVSSDMELLKSKAG